MLTEPYYYQFGNKFLSMCKVVKEKGRIKREMEGKEKKKKNHGRVKWLDDIYCSAVISLVIIRLISLPI